jgi:hypothetical protein
MVASSSGEFKTLSLPADSASSVEKVPVLDGQLPNSTSK